MSHLKNATSRADGIYIRGHIYGSKPKSLIPLVPLPLRPPPQPPRIVSCRWLFPEAMGLTQDCVIDPVHTLGCFLPTSRPEHIGSSVCWPIPLLSVIVMFICCDCGSFGLVCQHGSFNVSCSSPATTGDLVVPVGMHYPLPLYLYSAEDKL